ncbi:MAG: hypothetical protein ACFFFG_01860 [Candidatus Thorarchaeota archaeon]
MSLDAFSVFMLAQIVNFGLFFTLSFEHMTKYRLVIVKRSQAILYLFIIITQGIYFIWALSYTCLLPSPENIDFFVFYAFFIISTHFISISVNMIRLYRTQKAFYGYKANKIPFRISFVAAVTAVILAIITSLR